jgi:succinate dehydrogenase / fumarate reductase, membrane anchor subunit
MSVEQAYRAHFRPDTVPSRREVWSWFFVRISGLGLVFLVLGHMAIMHVLGGGVDRVDFEFVASRWAGPFWRTYDWLLLVLALTHGGLGARTAIADHLRKERVKKLATIVLYVVVGFMLVVGTLVIVTFDVSRIPGA